MNEHQCSRRQHSPVECAMQTPKSEYGKRHVERWAQHCKSSGSSAGTQKSRRSWFTTIIGRTWPGTLRRRFPTNSRGGFRLRKRPLSQAQISDFPPVSADPSSQVCPVHRECYRRTGVGRRGEKDRNSMSDNDRYDHFCTIYTK